MRVWRGRECSRMKYLEGMVGELLCVAGQMGVMLSVEGDKRYSSDVEDSGSETGMHGEWQRREADASSLGVRRPRRALPGGGVPVVRVLISTCQR